MTTLLHIDSSARSESSKARAHGSHSRTLSQRFVDAWCTREPGTRVIRRDVGVQPPPPVSERWIHAAFTAEAEREPWMHEQLSTSDMLVNELLAADVIVAGVPMYNFGPPAQFKAWIDNIVRVGRTFGFDRQRAGDPYWPLLTSSGKRVVMLSSRGDFGYGAGERIAHMNHVEPSVRTAFAYVGITQFHSIAAEYDEYGGERQRTSLEAAALQVDALVAELHNDMSRPNGESAPRAPDLIS